MIKGWDLTSKGLTWHNLASISTMPAERFWLRCLSDFLGRIKGLGSKLWACGWYDMVSWWPDSPPWCSSLGRLLLLPWHNWYGWGWGPTLQLAGTDCLMSLAEVHFHHCVQEACSLSGSQPVGNDHSRDNPYCTCCTQNIDRLLMLKFIPKVELLLF